MYLHPCNVGQHGGKWKLKTTQVEHNFMMFKHDLILAVVVPTDSDIIGTSVESNLPQVFLLNSMINNCIRKVLWPYRLDKLHSYVLLFHGELIVQIGRTKKVMLHLV